MMVVAFPVPLYVMMILLSREDEADLFVQTSYSNIVGSRAKVAIEPLTTLEVLDLLAVEYRPSPRVASQCAICLSYFERECKTMPMPCDQRHNCHVECISKWLVRKTKCPTCKRDVTLLGLVYARAFYQNLYS